jgi:hypothetical protein
MGDFHEPYGAIVGDFDKSRVLYWILFELPYSPP